MRVGQSGIELQMSTIAKSKVPLAQARDENTSGQHGVFCYSTDRGAG